MDLHSNFFLSHVRAKNHTCLESNFCRRKPTNTEFKWSAKKESGLSKRLANFKLKKNEKNKFQIVGISLMSSADQIHIMFVKKPEANLNNHRSSQKLDPKS